jgi:hypothetical protein
VALGDLFSRDMWTLEEKEVIERAIQANTPDPRPCPFCGKRAGHILADGFVFLSTARKPNAAEGKSTSLPSVALICRKCGTTTLINAVVLGLQALLPGTTVKQSDIS